MFAHVTIRVADLEASRRFYETLLRREADGDEFREWDEFRIGQSGPEHPVTRNLHVAFAAESRRDVDDFWRRGVDAGYTSDGEPGPRPQYHPHYYGAFLLDPDGNSVEAAHRPGRTETGPLIDHLWIGVADLEASRRFWEAVARALALGIGARDSLLIVAADRRHFALVADGRPPTENLHLAFPVADDEAVAGFHRVAAGAGFRGDGSCVLDPDGTQVEAVNHDR